MGIIREYSHVRIFKGPAADFLYELLSASSSRLETDYRPGGAGSLPEYQLRPRTNVTCDPPDKVRIRS